MPFDELEDSSRTSLRRVSVVSVDDTGTQQTLKLTGLKGEELSKVVRSQHYGFSSVPPKGGEGLLLEQGGRADRAHVLALEHKDHRPRKLKDGESVQYDTREQKVYISETGIKIVGGKNKLPVSITVGDSTFILAKDSITLKSGKIILDGKDSITLKSGKITLDGEVHLGGADASDLAAKCGGGCATKVFVK